MACPSLVHHALCPHVECAVSYMAFVAGFSFPRWWDLIFHQACSIPTANLRTPTSHLETTHGYYLILT